MNGCQSQRMILSYALHPLVQPYRFELKPNLLLFVETMYGYGG